MIFRRLKKRMLQRDFGKGVTVAKSGLRQSARSGVSGALFGMLAPDSHLVPAFLPSAYFWPWLTIFDRESISIAGSAVWLDTNPCWPGVTSKPLVNQCNVEWTQAVTQPANFETLLGGFVPPSSAFSKPQKAKEVEVGVGVGVLNKGGLRSDYGRQLHGRERGGRQLSKDQVWPHVCNFALAPFLFWQYKPTIFGKIFFSKNFSKTFF